LSAAVAPAKAADFPKDIPALAAIRRKTTVFARVTGG
jgi:hypothetical protein